MNLHDTYLYIFICIGVIITNLFVVYKYYNKTREGFNFDKIFATVIRGILTGLSYVMGPIGKFFRDNLKKSKKKSQHLIANFGFSGLKLIFLIVFIMIVIVTLPISIPILFMVISFILSIIFGIISFLISILVILCSPIIPVVAVGTAPVVGVGMAAAPAAKAGLDAAVAFANKFKKNTSPPPPPAAAEAVAPSNAVAGLPVDGLDAAAAKVATTEAVKSPLHIR